MIRETIKKFVPHRWRRPRYWVEDSIRKNTNLIVAGGPFKGMKYCSGAVDEFSWPRVLGTYEQELHDRIETLCSIGFSSVINVGAAEGYYAVGFLKRFPRASIIAFETEPCFKPMIRMLADLNGVGDRLVVKGHCDAESLYECTQDDGPHLVFMDVEGCEKDILDPDKVPGLREAYIIVEAQDFKDPSITGVLVDRFKDTHAVEIVRSGWRKLSDFPLKLSLVERVLLKRFYLNAMFEGRGDIMHWLCMTPRKN